MDQPREVPFHESANRPQLLMGGDRELILVSAILAAMLVFAVMNWWSILAVSFLADRGGARTHGEAWTSLASCLHPAHWLSGFLPRQEPDVRSSHDDPSKLEIDHASC
jgi:hypothetical protein